MKFHNHPEFTDNIADWNDSLNLYEGKHRILSSPRYLWMHELETSKDPENQAAAAKLRALREERSRYINLMRTIFNRYCGVIFSQDIDDTEVMTGKLGKYLENVDGEGNNFIDFIKKRIFLDRFLYGKSYVLIDSPATGAESLAQEQELGQRPYLQLLSARSVPDWQYKPDQHDRLEALRYEYSEVQPRTSLSEEPEIRLKTKTYDVFGGGYVISEYEWSEEDKEWVSVGDVTRSAVSELPVCMWQADESFASLITDPLLSFHNINSYLHNVLGFHGHPTRVVTGDFPENKRLAFTEFTTICIDGGTSVTQLNPDPLIAARELQMQAEINVYKAGFFLSRFIPSDSRAAQAEGSIKEQKEEFYSVIESEIKSLNDYINKILVQFAGFAGIKDFKGEITISTNIDSDEIDEFVSIVTAFKKEIEINPEWHKAVQKKATKFMGLSKEDKIIDGINNGKAVPQETPAQAAINRVVNELP